MTDLSAAAPRDVVRDVVLEILPSLNVTDFDQSRNLKDLGADSVDRIEIISTVLLRLGLSVPISTFNDTPDLQSMIGALEHLRATSTGSDSRDEDK